MDDPLTSCIESKFNLNLINEGPCPHAKFQDKILQNEWSKS